MNKTLFIAILMAVVLSLPAAAQVRLGVRGGLTVGELRFDRDVIDSDNRLGYSAGLVVDAGIPVVGLGIEASVLYSHRSNRLSDDHRLYKRHYIEIPVYARYRLHLSGAGRIIAPMAFTGPNFSILFDENEPTDIEHSRTVISWDVGGGVDLFNHLRVTATYGIGLTRALKVINREYDGETVNGKDHHWTLSAAWLF